MADRSSICSRVRIQSQPHDLAAVLPTPQTELLARVNDIAAGIAQWYELLTSLVTVYPPTASNLSLAAELGAKLLIHDAMELAAFSRKLTAPMMLPAVLEVAHV